MRKIVIVNESQFKRMVKKVLKEQNFPPIKGVTTDNTSVKNIPGRNYAVGNEEELMDPKLFKLSNEQADLQMSVIAMGVSFVPYVGWVASAAILGALAADQFYRGDTKEGALTLLFAILGVAIPLLRAQKLFRSLASLGEPGIIALGNAVKSGQKLTRTQINALIELVNNPEAVAKAIETLAKAKGVAIAQPSSMFTSALQKFKGEYLPYIATKVGYEAGWQIGNAITAPKSNNQKPGSTGSNW